MKVNKYKYSEFAKKFVTIMLVICMTVMLLPAACVSAAYVTVDASGNTTMISDSEGTIVASKVFTGVGKVTRLSEKTKNSNSSKTAYLKAKFTFSSKFKKKLKAFCMSNCKDVVSSSINKENNLTETVCETYRAYMKKTPSSVTVKNMDTASDGALAWTSKSCLKNSCAFVNLVDTDGDGLANKAVISILVYGKSGFSRMSATKTVNLASKKVSSSWEK